ncbi:hypothetical protein EGR_07328 [Echinococcus granulosus]|uniref:Uncharacterized protein n=1 Tax=Echinococcus granulosus TaxID=6210 RepID=W6UIC6_ECHGR|nr:hypothetical protein EGR_07328 [Echinococcus granulosus]EUB57857.1 hypothetical protein EGR_07328 [Echinococcus granulosus]
MSGFLCKKQSIKLPILLKYREARSNELWCIRLQMDTGVSIDTLVSLIQSDSQPIPAASADAMLFGAFPGCALDSSPLIHSLGDYCCPPLPTPPLMVTSPSATPRSTMTSSSCCTPSHRRVAQPSLFELAQTIQKKRKYESNLVTGESPSNNPEKAPVSTPPRTCTHSSHLLIPINMAKSNQPGCFKSVETREEEICVPHPTLVYFLQQKWWNTSGWLPENFLVYESLLTALIDLHNLEGVLQTTG